MGVTLDSDIIVFLKQTPCLGVYLILLSWTFLLPFCFMHGKSHGQDTDLISHVYVNIYRSSQLYLNKKKDEAEKSMKYVRGGTEETVSQGKPGNVRKSGQSRACCNCINKFF